jgi:trk system potassium uptake protein TrkH
MTFSNLILLVWGKKLGIGERVLSEQSFGGVPSAKTSKLILRIVLYTFAVELAGAILLFTRFRLDHSFSRAIWLSVFHSVSAFCNAGFGLFSDSLMGYRTDLTVNLTIMGLIILGGLGFVVTSELFSHFLKRTSTGNRRRLSLHARVVLTTTLGLIVGGALLLLLLESTHSTLGAGWMQRLLSGLFLSVTARTAGFNTVDTAQLTGATLLMLLALMAIGASPGSTGGGIRTTTFATICALVMSHLSLRPKVQLFNRQIPGEIVSKVLATTAAFFMAIFTGVLLLQITESWGHPPGATSPLFLDHLFETVSALGTVGLSTGVTPHLSFAGKIVIIGCMFLGRLGPLVVAGSLIGRPRDQLYACPRNR